MSNNRQEALQAELQVAEIELRRKERKARREKEKKRKNMLAKLFCLVVLAIIVISAIAGMKYFGSDEEQSATVGYIDSTIEPSAKPTIDEAEDELTREAAEKATLPEVATQDEANAKAKALLDAYLSTL